MLLTLKSKKHLSEWRQSDQEVQHYATVGVVRAIVVGLGGVIGQARSSTSSLLIGQELEERSEGKNKRRQGK